MDTPCSTWTSDCPTAWMPSTPHLALITHTGPHLLTPSRLHPPSNLSTRLSLLQLPGQTAPQTGTHSLHMGSKAHTGASPLAYCGPVTPHLTPWTLASTHEGSDPTTLRPSPHPDPVLILSGFHTPWAALCTPPLTLPGSRPVDILLALLGHRHPSHRCPP